MRRVRAIGWTLVALGLLSLAASVLLLVWTHLGQRADERSRWAVGVPFRTGRLLHEWLGLVSVEFIAVVLAVAVLLALVRRRVSRAAAALFVVVGANVTTQLLKAGLPRPDYGIGTTNTLPSGHVTVVASLVLATLIVAPAPLRRVVTLLASGAATLTGAAVLIQRWHRPSDVVAAYAVCAVFVGVALLLSARTGRVVDGAQTGPLPLGARRPGLVAHLAFALLGSALAGGFLLIAGLVALGADSNLLLGGVVLTGIALTATVLMALTGAGLEAASQERPPARRRTSLVGGPR